MSPLCVEQRVTHKWSNWEREGMNLGTDGRSLSQLLVLFDDWLRHVTNTVVMTGTQVRTGSEREGVESF